MRTKQAEIHQMRYNGEIYNGEINVVIIMKTHALGAPRIACLAIQIRKQMIHRL